MGFPYLSDGAIYAIWKYAKHKAEWLNNDDVFCCIDFGFNDSVKEFTRNIGDFIYALKASDLNMHTAGIKFHNDKWAEKYPDRYNKIITERKNNKKTPDLFEKVLCKKGITLDNLIFALIASPVACPGIIYFMEFTRNTENREKLNKFLNDYIEDFMHDNIKKEDKNFYIFERQRKQLLETLTNSIENYGKNFILTYNLSTTDDKKYLPIHAIIALEQLGCIESHRIWANTKGRHPMTVEYNIELTVTEKLNTLITKNLEVEGKNKNPHTPPSKYITNLTIVRPMSGHRFLVIVNNDYKKILRVSKIHPSWNLLFNVAENPEEGAYTEKTKENDNYLYYFNGKKENKLYTQTGYKITKILQREDDFIKPMPNIKIDIISERQLKIKLNKET
jgi:hypothetical protein